MKLDHIGDLLTALPALRRLRRHFPAARICLLASVSAPRAFLAGEDCVDELIEFDFFHARSGLGEKGLTEYDLRALGVPTVGIHSGVVDTAEWGADRDAGDSHAAQYGVQPVLSGEAGGLHA